MVMTVGEEKRSGERHPCGFLNNEIVITIIIIIITRRQIGRC